MITKNKIFFHALWGGIFGLISGAIISGIKFINYSSSYGRFFSKMNSEISWLPKPNPHFSHTLFWYIYFLVPGLLIGLAIGISDKSLRKIFFGVIGGIFGGLVAYWLHSFKDIEVLVDTFPSVIYAIFISLLIGLGSKSLKKIIGSIIGGIVASIPIGISTIIFMEFAAWLTWNAPSYPNLTYIPEHIFMVSLLTIGIYIGMERERKQ